MKLQTETKLPTNAKAVVAPRYVQKSNPWQLRIGERRVVLLAGDFLVACIALLLALYFWGSADRFPTWGLEFIRTRPPQWFFFLPLFWMVLLIELYDVRRAGDWKKTVQGVAAAVGVGIILYLLVYFYSASSDLPRNQWPPRRGVAAFVAAAAGLTLGWRYLYIRIFAAAQFMRRALLVGGGRSGESLLQVTSEIWPPPFFVVGVIDDDPQKQGTEVHGVPVIGTSDDLMDIVKESSVTDIIVAISGPMAPQMFKALLDAQQYGVEISRMPTVYEEVLGRVPIRLLESDWILRSFVDENRRSTFYDLVKRLMDLAGGFVGLLAFLLVYPFVALAIILDDGRPVIYGQTRLGRGGQPYTILKFRTMCNNAEPDGKPQWAKEHDNRATRVGRFLRKTHLDELPQFINVIRGEMSLVGPRAERPELVDYFQKHVPFYRARLLVKPGLTGWAQVNFSYASTIEETIIKLEYDLYYIKHRSLITDLIIMLRTPPTMLGFRGR